MTGPLVPDVAGALAAVAEAASAEGPEAALVCHRLATILDGVAAPAMAETLHRRAGTLLAGVPAGGPLDRDRVRWALSLADNLEVQHRPAEALDVLSAALALAQALLGPDDPDTRVVKTRLAGALDADRRA